MLGAFAGLFGWFSVVVRFCSGKSGGGRGER